MSSKCLKTTVRKIHGIMAITKADRHEWHVAENYAKYMTQMLSQNLDYHECHMGENYIKYMA